MLLTEIDKIQIEKRGMTESQVFNQLRQLSEGFPYLKLKGAATIDAGVLRVSEQEKEEYQKRWRDYRAGGKKQILKFVPASGAASRMFKDLFAFLSADYDTPQTDYEKEFFTHITKFAFYNALNEACLKNQGKTITELLDSTHYKAIVENLLLPCGLNYGQLPKGLILFHHYHDEDRTPMEEHLVEAALYANANNTANVHYTVSHEHLELFKEKVNKKAPGIEKKYGMKLNISFSEQKASTDTIAVNPDNTPFRNEDGSLLFRPGGHGALIENLNDVNADIIFVKNIDNVTPDKFKTGTITYKEVIAGVLVEKQAKTFEYLKVLDSGEYSHELLQEIVRFLQRDLYCRKDDLKELEDADLTCYLKQKLNRPMRVCGVVKNVGEPGGGPFIVYNQDGTTSLQILESSQIDTNNKEFVKMFTNGTHFNPVDLVCAVYNYKGEKFNLPDYVDHSTGFISHKSKNGKELKALELPGLWNGAMSDWNTIFVEVPLSTFNPVKVVNDLLREQHQ
ncbi:DUF4301 family protein [Prevotella sp. A2931]|uniref:DUF4301 family protein n=1 Tax=Prevotella illustrans TaxID=2800387 RepID=A0ABS3M2M2_9BACT|nr:MULTISPECIES: DUF4301 family protein [Prevotella]MBO1362380.1 DUF4301 family protein [Prevotella illustrans]PTL25101.1 DUF4301 domain-containing protein [Prevotella sp. oral taxon 820]